MRALGAGSQPGRVRTPTYFEQIAAETLPRIVAQLTTHPELEPMLAVSHEVATYEREHHNLAFHAQEPAMQAALESYVDLLSQNDQLPVASQLTREEVWAARRMLLASQDDDKGNTEPADKVLWLLEDKFKNGRFAQAAILLRLFETTAIRRRNNERTLFSEEMISRFGVVRVTKIPSGVVKRYQRAVTSADTPTEKLVAAARWLTENVGVNLNIRSRRNPDLASWRDALRTGNRLEALDHALLAIAPGRWRLLTEHAEGEIGEAVSTYLHGGALADYLIRLLKACYFIVLFTVKTGFEPFIRDYFRWVERTFRIPANRLLPELHRRTTVGERGIDETVIDIRRQQMDTRMTAIEGEWNNDRVRDAIQKLARMLETLDPNTVPPGEYDLGGLIIDQLVDMTCYNQSVMFRVHRLG